MFTTNTGVITSEDWQRYKVDFPELSRLELTKRIHEDFSDEDGWPPIVNGRVFMEMEFPKDDTWTEEEQRAHEEPDDPKIVRAFFNEV
jgi:hypothetical protein